MTETVRIAYDYQASLNLRLYDPEAHEASDLTAVDVAVSNMLAVDSAFERRVPVIINVDDDNHIIRVQANGLAQKEPLPPPPVPGVLITRMATQRGNSLFAEALFCRGADGSAERNASTHRRAIDPHHLPRRVPISTSATHRGWGRCQARGQGAPV
jgi:hypothetical protein